MLHKMISVRLAHSVLLLILITINGQANHTIYILAPADVSVSKQKIDAVASGIDSRTTQTSAGDLFEEDNRRLIELRSRSFDELLALATQMEIKWRRIDWNQYARIMIRICSEISNRSVHDPRLRKESERFARIALSHSAMFLWEHQSDLVGALGSRVSPAADDWLRERREKAGLWLQAWQRLDKEFDPTFDINDRKNRPLMRVFPPDETRLPAGTPPSAIKDPKARAQYEAALAENKRKAQRANKQFPLIAHGPSFRARAEHVLIYLYSQPPFRNNELRQYLEMYIRDTPARKRILDAVEKNAK
jgi:hypothetical protein